MNIFEEIKEKVDILELAKRLGIEIKTKGKTPQALCFNGHDRHSPSLTFYPNTNSYNCFGCDKNNGSVIDLVMNHEGINENEAVNWFKREYNISDGDNSWKTRNYKPRATRHEAHKPAPQIQPKVIDRLQYAPIYKTLIESLPFVDGDCYLIKERALTKEVLDNAGVRHIPKGFNYKVILKDFTDEQLFNAGLLKDNNFPMKPGNFIIPYYDNADNIIYMQYMFEQTGKLVKLPLYNNEEHTPKPVLYLPKQFKDYKPGDIVYINEGAIDALSMLTLHTKAIAFMDATPKSQELLSQTDILTPFNLYCLGDFDKGTGYKLMRQLKEYMILKHKKIIEILNIRNYAKETFNIANTDGIKDFNDILKDIKAGGLLQ